MNLTDTVPELKTPDRAGPRSPGGRHWHRNCWKARSPQGVCLGPFCLSPLPEAWMGYRARALLATVLAGCPRLRLSRVPAEAGVVRILLHEAGCSPASPESPLGLPSPASGSGLSLCHPRQGLCGQPPTFRTVIPLEPLQFLDTGW